MIKNIGLISDFVKNKNLENKWQQRKANNFMQKREDSYLSEIKKQREDMDRAARLQRIDSKMKSGQKLSGPDMEYLRKNAPDTYEKAVKIQKEREEYRRALENCKTKEEVQQLNMSRAQQFLAEAKAVSNNPNIPEEKKQEMLEEIAMRAAAIFNEFAEFVKSDEYAELPSENDLKDETDKIDEGENDVAAAEQDEAGEKASLPDSDYLKQIFEIKDAHSPDKDMKPAKSEKPDFLDKKPDVEPSRGYIYNAKAGLDAEEISIKKKSIKV